MIEERKLRKNPFNNSFELNECPSKSTGTELSNSDAPSHLHGSESSNTVDNSSLTKSKKKRLRVKKAKLRIQAEKDKCGTTAPETNLNVISEPNPLVITVPNNSNCSCKKTDENISKMNSSKTNQEKKLSTPPLEKNKNEKIVNSSENTDQVKSREDILAERQAKKLSKQNSKKSVKQSVSDSSSIVKTSTSGSNNENLQNQKGDAINKDKIKLVETKISSESDPKILKSEAQTKMQNNLNKVKCDSMENKIETKSVDMVDGEITMRTKQLVISDLNETKMEKSREETLALREAKKAAKLSKKQGKDGQTAAATEVIVGKTPELIPVKQSETVNEKSKSELKAERRAKQEAQRAAKEAAQNKASEQQQPVVSEKKVPPKKSPEIKLKKEIKVEEKVSERKVHQHKLFSHLYIEPQPKDLNANIHPAIVELGKKFASRVVNGSNARCVALLNALKQVIIDYKVSSMSDINRGLEAELAAAGLYLSQFRPLSVSMTNSLRYLRSHLTQTSQLPEEETKRRLLEAIDTFIREQVDVAGQAISNTVQEKISSGDVILTYGCSSLVWRCLKDSYLAGKEFTVVVVDGGPWYEGRELLRRLAALSIPCTYLLISAVGFAMTKISKVLLGAHALLANGYVMSRTGSAMVALTASAHSVPVLVCCETYKFCERVQADSFVYNELGGCEETLAKGVKYLSPVYDITPPNLVTAVVTELAILPCTSVPVVLRVKPSDIHHAA